MTAKDFVCWLRGFAQAASTFTLTPKQWDDIKEQLNQVDLNESDSTALTANGYTESTTSSTGKFLLTDNKI